MRRIFIYLLLAVSVALNGQTPQNDLYKENSDQVRNIKPFFNFGLGVGVGNLKTIIPYHKIRLDYFDNTLLIDGETYNSMAFHPEIEMFFNIRKKFSIFINPSLEFTDEQSALITPINGVYFLKKNIGILLGGGIVAPEDITVASGRDLNLGLMFYLNDYLSFSLIHYRYGYYGLSYPDDKIKNRAIILSFNHLLNSRYKRKN